MKKSALIYFFLGLLVFSTGCSDDDPPQEPGTIRSISGTYTNSDSEHNRYFHYDFVYDDRQRVVSLVYTGEMYVYGEGLIQAGYTYDIAYGNDHTTVTLHIKDPMINIGGRGLPYEGLPEQETIPLTFDQQGNMTAITGRRLWLHPENTGLTYDNGGNLVKITETNGAYARNETGLAWKNSALTSQTRDELNVNGEPLYRIRREFAPSTLANDYSVDLNWLAAEIGLNNRNALSMLGLIGLTGNRSPNLIESTVEGDETEGHITYSATSGRIEKITSSLSGATTTFHLGYE